MPEYFYQKQGQVIGPISGKQLRANVLNGVITPDTPVRAGTTGKWVLAGGSPQLFDSTGKPMQPATSSTSASGGNMVKPALPPDGSAAAGPPTNTPLVSKVDRVVFAPIVLNPSVTMPADKAAVIRSGYSGMVSLLGNQLRWIFGKLELPKEVLTVEAEADMPAIGDTDCVISLDIRKLYHVDGRGMAWKLEQSPREPLLMGHPMAAGMDGIVASLDLTATLESSGTRLAFEFNEKESEQKLFARPALKDVTKRLADRLATMILEKADGNEKVDVGTRIRDASTGCLLAAISAIPRLLLKLSGLT